MLKYCPNVLVKTSGIFRRRQRCSVSFNVLQRISAYNGQRSENVRQYSIKSSTDGILVNLDNKVLTMTLNRPERYNAYQKEMYEETTRIFNEAAEDDDVSILKVTGAGKYFSSGNDLTSFKNSKPSDIIQLAADSRKLLELFVAAYIDFPKPLIAAVNGPAIGISVSTLPLYDAVYASDNATFQTPFAKIAQSPEACSSYLFPKIMGHPRAGKMLMFGETLSAEEAERTSLVSKVFPAATFQSDVDAEIEKMRELPLKSLVYTKRLMRDHERELLHKVNKAECERLFERWTSEDIVIAMMKFFSRSK